jgi:hypothetical protein
MKMRIFLLFALFVLVISGGPSYAALSELTLRDNIGVSDVSGGDKTNPHWESEIGNDDFRRILESSLNSAGLLERARGEGRYLLSAVLESIDQPSIGVSLTVTTLVKYTLTDERTGETVYQESVAGEYSTKFWDSLLNSKRLQVAGKGAARDNAKKLTGRLVQSSLSQGQVSLAQ